MGSDDGSDESYDKECEEMWGEYGVREVSEYQMETR